MRAWTDLMSGSQLFASAQCMPDEMSDLNTVCGTQFFGLRLRNATFSVAYFQ